MSIRSSEDLAALLHIGSIVGRSLRLITEHVKPGVKTRDLDAYAGELLKQEGARCAPKVEYGFPGDICISVNDEAVHGIPGERAIREGDVVKLDLTAEKDGYVADAAVTVNVPPVGDQNRRMAECVRRAFDRGMELARAGVRISQMGGAIDREVRASGFTTLTQLTGHGVGRKTHEDPVIPNFFDPYSRERLTEGLVIAVEPIISSGRNRIVTHRDGWTIRTADRHNAAHFEHTIIITSGEPIFVTAA
jgi:methionyl aminopeptidase